MPKMCGENHITRDCPIKQKLETPYCINCNIYGHMANYRGCPSFPKPPKGAAKNNRNSYTNIYNSLVRPNISYAQATTGANNSKNTPQMATRGPGSSAQTETNKPIPPNNSPRGSQSESMFTVPNIQSESNLLALSQAKKLKKLSTQMKNHSHASRIPSPDQSPTCHSAEWKTPLLPCPTS
ncbi:hypothetical protein TNCV_786071 [Trichonephila clavipes]|nr:hypothetical protein TNCV_786071 [Trichonephila clavipes]